MQQLTTEGHRRVSELSQRYFVSTDAVMTLLQALVNGHGTMAQFYHPELGGSGQWMQGGMTMIGDMFNSGLKSKVEGLCSELSSLLASQPFAPAPASYQSQSQGGQQQQQGGSGGFGSSPVSLFVPASGGGSGSWWPGDLGVPSSTGSQNDIRYAYFPGARRLAVDVNGRVSVYDTLDHQISGVSQQQGSGASVTFTSQYGVVSVLSLPIVSGDLAVQQAPGAGYTAAPAQQAEAAMPRASSAQEADIFGAIERLAELRQKGIITEQEFAAKKTDLLSRL
ncbi:SHOCT domain-containing protein [Sorangium sp. So ce406]|uniref:SHOCT domain-containing protein n=1 Tax=Sorangium sp. So ce406 TaxID=3133311 RepID=UPI003F5BB4A2